MRSKMSFTVNDDYLDRQHYRQEVAGLPVVIYWVYEKACDNFENYFPKTPENFAVAIVKAIKLHEKNIGVDHVSSYQAWRSTGEMWPCYDRLFENLHYLGDIIKIIDDRDYEDATRVKSRWYDAVVGKVAKLGYDISIRSSRTDDDKTRTDDDKTDEAYCVKSYCDKDHWPLAVKYVVRDWQKSLESYVLDQNASKDDFWFMQFEAALARRMIEQLDARTGARAIIDVGEEFVMDTIAEIDCTYMFGSCVQLPSFYRIITCFGEKGSEKYVIT